MPSGEDDRAGRVAPLSWGEALVEGEASKGTTVSIAGGLTCSRRRSTVARGGEGDAQRFGLVLPPVLVGGSGGAE